MILTPQNTLPLRQAKEKMATLTAGSLIFNRQLRAAIPSDNVMFEITDDKQLIMTELNDGFLITYTGSQDRVNHTALCRRIAKELGIEKLPVKFKVTQENGKFFFHRVDSIQ